MFLNFSLVLASFLAGALVLIELMVLSVFYVYAFGIVKIRPSAAPGYDASVEPKNSEHVTFTTFVCNTWRLWDVLGTHALANDATAPLAKASAQV